MSDALGPETATYEIQGRTVRLPVAVRRARVASATFLVPSAAAAELIRATGLELFRPVRSRALCSIAFVDYLESDLGAYHEVAVAFMVRPPGGGRPGAYIHQLPVDQGFTLQAGRDIWGFPKWMTESTIAFGARAAACDLREAGEHILTLTVRRSPLPVPAREVTMDAWSFHDGVLRRTPWVMRYGDVSLRPGGATLVLGERHEMAVQLRAIGLPRRAVLTTVAGQMTARFEASTQVPLTVSARI